MVDLFPLGSVTLVTIPLSSMAYVVVKKVLLVLTQLETVWRYGPSSIGRAVVCAALISAV